MLGTGASAAMGQDFGMGRHKTAQSLAIFVVYSANFVGTKVANFFDLGLVIPLAITIIVRHE
jgi:hypothetical protein